MAYSVLSDKQISEMAGDNIAPISEIKQKLLNELYSATINNRLIWKIGNSRIHAELRMSEITICTVIMYLDNMYMVDICSSSGDCIARIAPESHMGRSMIGRMYSHALIPIEDEDKTLSKIIEALENLRDRKEDTDGHQ